MASKEIERTRPQTTRAQLQRNDPINLLWSSPFSMMRRMQDEIDQWVRQPIGRLAQGGTLGSVDWAPAIDVFQRGNDLVVRADIPGMSKDDIEAEIGDDTLTIRGERNHEHEEEREGIFRSERSYGSFYRVIPLPEGTIADNAKASFKDGVLEIVMPAPPPEVKRGRRLEIGGDASTQKHDAKQEGGANKR